MKANTPKLEEQKEPNRERVLQLLGSLHSLDDDLRKTVWLELRSLDPNRLFAILQEIMTGFDGLKYNAAEAMIRLDPSLGVDLVLPLLSSHEPDMRLHICGLLSDFGDERSINQLIYVLQNDVDSNIRYAAAFALGKLGDKRALPALQWAEKHDLGTNYEGDPITRVAREAIQSTAKMTTGKY